MSTRRNALLWTGAGALLVAFVLFAPLFEAGICVDAQDTSRSYCRDWQTSLVGMETSLWMWLGGSGVLLSIGLLTGWWITRRGNPDARLPENPPTERT